jgi:hypothetical protein
MKTALYALGALMISSTFAHADTRPDQDRSRHAQIQSEQFAETAKSRMPVSLRRGFEPESAATPDSAYRSTESWSGNTNGDD